MGRTIQSQVMLYVSAAKAAELRRVATARGVTQQELLRKGLEWVLATSSSQGEKATIETCVSE